MNFKDLMSCKSLVPRMRVVGITHGSETVANVLLVRRGSILRVNTAITGSYRWLRDMFGLEESLAPPIMRARVARSWLVGAADNNWFRHCDLRSVLELLISRVLIRRGAALNRRGACLMWRDMVLMLRGAFLIRKGTILMQKDAVLRQKEAFLMQKGAFLTQEGAFLAKKGAFLMQESKALTKQEAILMVEDLSLRR